MLEQKRSENENQAREMLSIETVKRNIVYVEKDERNTL